MWRALFQRRLEKYLKIPLLLLLGICAFIFYITSTNERACAECQCATGNPRNNSSNNEIWIQPSKYRVYNKKCRMPSMNPYDPSIRRFVKGEKFVACSSEPLLSSNSRKPNGSIYLVIDNIAAEHYKSLICCWAPISRPKGKGMDSNISVGLCTNFKQNVLLSEAIEVVFVSCTAEKTTKNKEKPMRSAIKVYENVHAVINPERVKRRMSNTASALLKNSPKSSQRRALSVLMLGLDSVSNLNFYRTMPLTRRYFEKRGWAELRAYNKIGDNTLPNWMAILTGQNEKTVKECFEKIPDTMDNFSMIWRNFKNAGYTTAYAEDQPWYSTFNFDKGGFVEPPTDYYLRAYVIATEKLLKSRRRYFSSYCTGPELTVDRIFDVAADFSKAFINTSYFGLFWANAVSHGWMNGPSLYDSRFLEKLQSMENRGVMDDAMIVVFSDHGMRYGDGRDTLIGWYEDRLPFVYIWLPKWFREENPESYDALLINQDRLTSPYDLRETLRDIIQRAGGEAPASSGCPSCLSLFKPVPFERGCKDAGISAHWCACDDFESFDVANPIAVEGAQQFVQYMNNVSDQYKTESGTRLCSELTLKRIMQVKRVIDLDGEPHGEVLKLFYQLEVVPGGGKFETTISYHGPGEFTIEEEDITRINIYGLSSSCLAKGYKSFCQCKT